MASKKPTTRKTPAAKTSAPKSTPKRTTASARRSSPAGKTTVTSSATPTRETHATKAPRTMKVRRSSLITGIIVLVLLALLYIFRSVFVVATVNGQPISRLTLYRELEKQGGKAALNSIITQTLIEQEARKKHVSVSQDEVNAEIKKISDNLAKQGQKLDQVLQAQGMTRDSLESQIRLQKLAEKMVGQDVKVTDQEVNDYYDKNKDSLPQGQDEAQLKASIRDRLKSQKLNDKFQSWLETLQKNAKINYLVNY